MAIGSFDIRHLVRSEIGIERDIDGDNFDEYCIRVKNDEDDWVYIPMYLPGECRTGELPNLPLIEMTLVTCPSRIAGIEHTLHNECYFDFNIYYANTDDVSATTFGTQVANSLCSYIYDNYTSIPTSYYVEVINSSLEGFEQSGKQVVFHRVVQCYSMNYDR